MGRITDHWAFRMGLLMVIICVSQMFYGAYYRTEGPNLVYDYIPISEWGMKVQGNPTAPVARSGSFSLTLTSDSQGIWAQAVSAGVGGNLTEVGTFGVLGIAMTAADDVRRLTPFPDNVDKNYPMAVRAHYTSSSGDDDGAINWLYHTAKIPISGALTEVTNSGIRHHAGWDTINFGPVDSTTVASAIRVTKWDTIGVDSLAVYSKSDLWLQAMELEADGDASADEIRLLAVEYVWVPKMGVGSRPDSIAVSGPTVGGVNKGIWLRNKNR